jgi:hypothetical protein
MRTPASLLLAACLIAPSLRGAPEEGFTDILPGEGLAGWRGGDTFDHRKLMEMPADKRAAKIDQWNKAAQQHWRPEGSGADRHLFTTGKGPCLATLKDYGDIDFRIDYRISPKGDSGIYLRNIPQVQIWDPEHQDAWKHGAKLGSGGLWNNSGGKPGKDPVVRADKPAGEWNSLRVLQLGERVTVWLNGQQVVDHARLENYYDRSRPIPASAPLLLQSHGDPVLWRNARIREIPGEEANAALAAKDEAGFQPVFDGKSLAGWKGALDNYEVVDGAIRCKKGKGGTIFTEKAYADFALRLEFRLPKGGNNGLALRYPGKGNPAYDGFIECQVLDDNYETATGSKIDLRQAHGSAYGLVAAARGYQRPVGQWNFQEVTLVGKRLKVELNGTLILDADLGKVDLTKAMGNAKHPGLGLASGHIGFAGHNDPVEFRSIRVREIAAAK